ncbi:MAG: riboflavin synthase subunit alpha [Vicingaceae bacterium]|nr:MAG: riboflavin synthase subunit alpha [Vicingaceae bacterium]
MFTGIVESIGKVINVENEAGNMVLTIEAPFFDEIYIDQSIAHNGVCLTVNKLFPRQKAYQVILVPETLQKTNFKDIQTGDLVNLERSMPANGRFDGHIVQGHVDCTAECIDIQQKDGSLQYTFKPENGTRLIVEKGSVCVNGISLTAFNVNEKTFDVAIIPYTFQHTNINTIVQGSRVNIEYDVLGKYIAKLVNCIN